MNRKTIIKAITALNAFASPNRAVPAFNVFCKGFKDRVEFYTSGRNGVCNVTVKTETGLKRPTRMFALERSGVRDALEACRVLRTDKVKFEINQNGEYTVRIGSFVWSEPTDPESSVIQLANLFNVADPARITIRNPEHIETMKHSVTAMKSLNTIATVISTKNDVLNIATIRDGGQVIFACQTVKGSDDIEETKKRTEDLFKIMKFCPLATGLEFLIDKTSNNVLVSSSENNIAISIKF